MSDAMKDFFGDVPGRPDHDDFWKLAEIVLGMDALMEKPDGFEDAVRAASVDMRSLAYLAMQRAARGMQAALVPQGAACWLDGFIAGIRYQQRKARDTT